MAKVNDILTLLESEQTREFRPYVEISKEADAINVYFRPDADYSKRLTDHVTLFLALKDNSIVGCRIKGIRDLLRDLPNFVDIDHDGVKLKLIFWSFRGSAKDDYARDAINELARGAGELELEPC